MQKIILGLLLICFHIPAFAAEEEAPPEEKTPGYVSLGQPLVLNLAEDRLLRATHMYQQETDWHTRRPDLG